MNSNLEIENLIKELKGIELAKSYYKDILFTLKELHQEKSEYEELLGESLKKVQQSESINYKSLFNKLVGRHTKILEIQKQEYLRITLEFNEINKSINVLNYEKELIEDKIDRELELQTNLKTKLRNIHVVIKDENLNNFKKVYKAIEDQLRLLKEIEEAIRVSQEVIILIESAEEYLTLGGRKEQLVGLSIEMILDDKDFDIIKLQELISKIKFKLQEFETEMGDLFGHLSLKTIETNKYSENFGKMFREIVLLDWQKNNSLLNSIEFLKNYKISMKENQRLLDKDRDQIQGYLKYLETQKDQLLKEK